MIKKILFTVSLLSFSFFLNAQNNNSSAKLSCSDVLEYGTIERGSNGERHLVIKNEGTSPLIINGVSSSCGCTVPSWPKEPIQPGAEAKIEVKYNTYIVGKINKSITINSNSLDSNVKLVRLNGEVIVKN